ncbi:MAG: glycosyltransferase family 2 protein [Firmicutes bacterium]|nr:glycosyltransferase family 2 protein [Bacillota bacterium]
MKLLTVTVPCYNSQDYMEKCVNSLLTGGDRVQIVIIDDGSKDATGEISDRYGEKYPDIVTVVHQENGGHGEGINQGLAHATGTYFKVVDSDDWVSSDFCGFLDTLEQCEKCGGVDLFVTNYYYEHADGKGNRSICYANALPEDRIFGWEETSRFQMHQLLTIHSCTFRTAVLRENTRLLPKHVFYEDNLMVYQGLPFVSRLYYKNIDLYRYFIGRDGQSVQRDVMTRRYQHQIIVTQRCFEACHLDEIAQKKLRTYLKHELFMMFGISALYARLNKSAEAEENLNKMWEACEAFDPKWAKHFRKHSPLSIICIPGKTGQRISGAVYTVANKVVRFN